MGGKGKWRKGEKVGMEGEMGEGDENGGEYTRKGGGFLKNGGGRI